MSRSAKFRTMRMSPLLQQSNAQAGDCIHSASRKQAPMAETVEVYVELEAKGAPPTRASSGRVSPSRRVQSVPLTMSSV